MVEDIPLIKMGTSNRMGLAFRGPMVTGVSILTSSEVGIRYRRIREGRHTRFHKTVAHTRKFSRDTPVF